jgi:hypothetical protein
MHTRTAQVALALGVARGLRRANPGLRGLIAPRGPHHHGEHLQPTAAVLTLQDIERLEVRLEHLIEHTLLGSATLVSGARVAVSMRPSRASSSSTGCRHRQARGRSCAGPRRLCLRGFGCPDVARPAGGAGGRQHRHALGHPAASRSGRRAHMLRARTVPSGATGPAYSRRSGRAGVAAAQSARPDPAPRRSARPARCRSQWSIRCYPSTRAARAALHPA